MENHAKQNIYNRAQLHLHTPPFHMTFPNEIDGWKKGIVKQGEGVVSFHAFLLSSYWFHDKILQNTKT